MPSKRTTSKSPARGKKVPSQDDVVEIAKAQARKNLEKRKTEKAESIKAEKVEVDTTYIEKYEDLFDSIDADHNGSIDPDELEIALGDHLKWTPYRIDKLMRHADLNNDGTLDIEEFARIMEEHKGSMDMWGNASDNLWQNWRHKLSNAISETMDVVDDLCQPAKNLSANHSTEFRVNVVQDKLRPEYMRRASPVTRFIAAIVGQPATAMYGYLHYLFPDLCTICSRICGITLLIS